MVDDYYRRHNANVARAVHALGEAAGSFTKARGAKARRAYRRTTDDLVLTSAPRSRST